MYEFKIQGNLVEKLSDVEFFDFCVQNHELRIERDKDHNILIMSPTTYFTGDKNAKLLIEFGIWNKEKQLGKVFDSSAGFTLPDGSIKSPDISWISKERDALLSDTEKNKFASIAPDFVLELMSKSDTLKKQKEKMEEYISNDVKLGWLVDLENETVFIYRADGTIAKVIGFDNQISGEDILEGFVLDLVILKD